MRAKLIYRKNVRKLSESSADFLSLFSIIFLRRVQRRASEKLSWDAAKRGAEKKGKNNGNLKTNWQ